MSPAQRQTRRRASTSPRFAIPAVAVLCAGSFTGVAAADPVDVYVTTYVHDSVTVFDGVEHMHPWGSFEQFIWAMSSALWTVDMWSGPGEITGWQYSFSIDYDDFGLPSYISFPYLDLNLDIKEPNTTEPITEFIVTNGAGLQLPLEYGAIVEGGRIELMLDRNEIWAVWDDIVSVHYNQGPPAPLLIDLEVSPADVTLTSAAPSAALTVTGFYDDASQQDLTLGSAGTLYQSGDTLVAVVTNDGIVHAIWQGSTTVFATNSKLSDIANITVEPGDYPIDGDDDGDIDEDDLCAWLANPIDINHDGVINQLDWDTIVDLLPEPYDDCNGNDVPDGCDIEFGDSDDCNANGIPDECEPDCNANGVPDECDITGQTSDDCDANGVPDECDIAGGADDVNGNGVPDSCEPDCNANSVPDDWDIAQGTSVDCDADGVPDECGDDCNSNGVADSCDIADGVSGDCNGNGIPDECDIAAGDSADADANGIPDECEADCNDNGIPDAFDISSGLSDDCNLNGVPDECEPDCNANGVNDECDIAAKTSNDCNANGIPDECDIATGPSNDANGNNIPDECEVDCNNNGLPDDFDIASGTSADCDENGVPDECDPDCNSNGVPDACEGVEELTTLFPNDGPPGTSDDRVALSGDVAVLGSYLDDTRGTNAGAAYIFERQGSAWLQSAKVFANDGAAGDQFGRAIAVEDNIVVVGARLHSARGTYAGAAYVFEKINDQWVQVAKLQPDNLEPGDRFGVSVGISGSTIVVGAGRKDSGALDAGTVYIYRRLGSDWVVQTQLFAADPTPETYFGASVAISNGRIIVGAWGQDVAGANSGSVYIFHPTVDGWEQNSKLTPATLGPGDEIGRSVAIEGDWAIIGAWRDDDLAPNAGAAYIYRYDGSAWFEDAKITGSNGQALDGYGWAVDITDGTALVGAFGHDTQANSAGSAYIYRFDGVDWHEELVAYARTPEANDNFGNSVAIDGPIALIGSPGGTAVNARMFSITTFADCNDNGIPDECEIESGDSVDNNGNGVPDECEPKNGDSNSDGKIDITDLFALLDAWGACTVSCDACLFDLTGPDGTPDCTVDLFDLLELLSNWGG